MTDFSIVNPIAVLKEGIGKLPETDQSFALSLLSQYAKKGSLSTKQMFWVDNFAKQIANGSKSAVPAMKTTEVGNLDGIKALFDKAAANLKKPSITIEAGGGYGGVKLSVATKKAMKPGTINVVGSDGVWYGRVDGTTFEASKKQEAPTWVINFLKALSADPAKTASIHGKLTGKCCFCNKNLTDPQSTAVGYGKVCAGHYGLPWGQHTVVPNNLAGYAKAGPIEGHAKIDGPIVNGGFVDSLAHLSAVDVDAFVKADPANALTGPDGEDIPAVYDAVKKAKSHAEVLKIYDEVTGKIANAAAVPVQSIAKCGLCNEPMDHKCLVCGFDGSKSAVQVRKPRFRVIT